MDLDLLRGLYIPLAIGHKPSLSVLGSRLKAKSRSSATPTMENLGVDLNNREACMSPGDVRTDFSNVDVLWSLSDRFGRRLQAALARIRDLDVTVVPPLPTPSSDHTHQEIDDKETVADILLDMARDFHSPSNFLVLIPLL